MANLFIKLLNSPAPIRKVILYLIKNSKFGSYRFRQSVGAVERPHYAYLLSNAARLARRLGHTKFSVIEYGVAGGRGLLALERHAREIERLYSVDIEIYGFDTGKGLPNPKDYRDLPYHWKEGFFAMEQPALKEKLTKAKLVLGDIEETSKTFFKQFQPAPIGALIHDFDFYSSTTTALTMLKNSDEHFLPRVFCYFDDTMGSEIELYNDFTGERLAIHDFNKGNESIKIAFPYYILDQRPETWHHQIWICHFFKHPQYNTFISSENQQLRI